MNFKDKLHQISSRTLLLIIASGIWVIVLQNAGIIPRFLGTKKGVQSVYVIGGNIDADVSGTVDIDDIRGSVNVNGDVDVNISRINGQRNVFFNNPGRGEKDRYYVLPVAVQ
jgi:hypothetical protein